MLRTDDGEAVYRRCSTHHHHTSSAAPAAAPSRSRARPSRRWADAVAAEHGFTAVSHTLEIFGTCADCATS